MSRFIIFVVQEGYWDMMSANKSLTASLLVLTLLYVFGVFERNNAANM